MTDPRRYWLSFTIMRLTMPPFRRKKSGKSFPVKVCTLDAELEFNLQVSDCIFSYLIPWQALRFHLFVFFSGERQGEIYSNWFVGQSVWGKLGTSDCSMRIQRVSFLGWNLTKKVRIIKIPQRTLTTLQLTVFCCKRMILRLCLTFFVLIASKSCIDMFLGN